MPSRVVDAPRAAALRALPLAVAALVLAGCTGGEEQPAAETAPNVVQPGAPGAPSRTLSADELESLEPPRHTDADVAFVQGMIQHHAQALLMTDLVRTRKASDDLKLLARRMDLAQESEIELMQRWLQERDEEAPALHRVHGHAHGPRVDELMPGMATEEELDQLRRARGARFERLFLELMIRHHEGALTMVRELREAGGSVESEIDALARHIEADQGIELARMRSLLEQP